MSAGKREIATRPLYRKGPGAKRGAEAMLGRLRDGSGRREIRGPVVKATGGNPKAKLED